MCVKTLQLGCMPVGAISLVYISAGEERGMLLHLQNTSKGHNTNVTYILSIFSLPRCVFIDKIYGSKTFAAGPKSIFVTLCLSFGNHFWVPNTNLLQSISITYVTIRGKLNASIT